MDGKLVTGLPSEDQEGGGESRLPSFRYIDKFDELCGYYMSIGMSYEDFWDGDPCMVISYRRMDELKTEQRNYDLWLQGAYIYEALLCASPAFNPMSKKKPYPYRDNPIPITKNEIKRAKEHELDKKMREGREAMRIMMAEINKQFQERREIEDGS